MKADVKECFGQGEVVMGEKAAEQHLMLLWAVLLKPARVQCSCRLPGNCGPLLWACRQDLC